MAELKTKPTKESVHDFISAVEDEQKRRDCNTLLKIMKEMTGANPRMWGPSIIGFGSYHYKYASGHEGDMCVTGFSPRKQSLTVYITMGLERHKQLLKKLGKFKTAKSCLYLKKLEDVDLAILKELIKKNIEAVPNKEA